jgi:hypothetical protein
MAARSIDSGFAYEEFLESSDRPTIRYAQMITEAINSTESKKITLSGIYSYVMEKYPYFKTAGAGWKVLYP